ncbi:hypothetical protein E3P99_00009 [Wallemia hederae]|uniref:Zn(2)-C6 fungal-type domain-containing protein n=1 Tax=Wallemia hederae TaxID=1540922 RepID=A0A4T0G0E6_9BASI|nr:hypothetical protein E3P99_00009 [Wallemia hederae]
MNHRFSETQTQTQTKQLPKPFPLPLPEAVSSSRGSHSHSHGHSNGAHTQSQSQSQYQNQNQSQQQSNAATANQSNHHNHSTYNPPKSIYSGPIPPPSLFRNNDSSNNAPTLPTLTTLPPISSVTRKRKSSEQSSGGVSVSDEQPEQQRGKKGRSARRRACEECARAKARCKVEPGDGDTPPMCTRCKMYGHTCILPEGYVVDNEWMDDETPKKRGRRNTINADSRDVKKEWDWEREREMQRRMSEAAWQYHLSPPTSYQYVPLLPQQQQRYTYPGIQYPPSPAPSIDVAFLQAEMASHPFLRNIAGYDLGRLSLFLSAAVRVGLSNIAQPDDQPGQSSQGSQQPHQPLQPHAPHPSQTPHDSR